MKRRTFVKGAVALPVGLAACGGSEGSSAQPDAKISEGDGQATFWTPSELPEPRMSTRIQA